MGANGKAILATGKGKALPIERQAQDNQAMLSTAEALRQKLARVIDDGFTQVQIAAACGVSKQAVQGWKKTGRIDKRHLVALAELTSRPLEWWLDIQAETTTTIPHSEPVGQTATVHSVNEPQEHYKAARWPFVDIAPHDYSRLTTGQRILVEGFIKGLLAESGRDKRAQTSHAA